MTEGMQRLRDAPAYDAVKRPLLRLIGPARGAAVQLLERYLGVHSHDRSLYLASSWLTLHQLFRGLEVAEDDVFVEIGCAMGRVVFVASTRPFKRVIGLEQDQELAATARANIERSRRRQVCRDVQIVTTDAREWEIPDDLTVVYCFTMLRLEDFEALVRKLVESIRRKPRTLRFIYCMESLEDRKVLETVGRAQAIDYKVPLYIRHRFRDVSLYLMSPSSWPDEEPLARTGGDALRRD